MLGWLPQDSCNDGDSDSDWQRFSWENRSSKPTSWSKNGWQDSGEKSKCSLSSWEDSGWQGQQTSWNENSWQRSDWEKWASTQTLWGKNGWQENGAESEALQSSWEDRERQQPQLCGSKIGWVQKDTHRDAPHSGADAEAVVQTVCEEGLLPPPASPEHETSGVGSMEAVVDQPKANDAVPSAKNRRGRGEARLWCEILLDRMRDHLQLCSLDQDFELVPMLIGVKGQKMSRIHAETNAKIRIRGRGSGHFEVEDKTREAPVPLMCVVTADRTHADAFVKAVDMTVTEIMRVAVRFQKFCGTHKQNCDIAALYRFGEVSEDAKQLLLCSPLNVPPPTSVPGVPSFAEMLQAKTCRPLVQTAKKGKKPTPRQSRQHEGSLQVSPDLQLAEQYRYHAYDPSLGMGHGVHAHDVAHNATMLAYNQSVHARMLYYHAQMCGHQPLDSQFPTPLQPIWQEGPMGQPKPMQTEAAVKLEPAPEQSRQGEEPDCDEDHCELTDEALKQAMQAQVHAYLTESFQ